LRRRVGHEAFLARATGPLVVHAANGVRSTRRRLTGIDAPVVTATLASAAIRIVVATKQAHVMQADVAQEAVIVNTASQNTVSFQTFLVEGTIAVSAAHRQAHAVSASITGHAVDV